MHLFWMHLVLLCYTSSASFSTVRIQVSSYRPTMQTNTYANILCLTRLPHLRRSRAILQLSGGAGSQPGVNPEEKQKAADLIRFGFPPSLHSLLLWSILPIRPPLLPLRSALALVIFFSLSPSNATITLCNSRCLYFGCSCLASPIDISWRDLSL
jgi:hypothetical protein